MNQSFAASAEQLLARLDAAQAAAVLQAECNQKLDACLEEKGEAQQAVEQLKKQLEAKGGELQKVVGERDARAKEKGEAQQAVEQLKKQLEAKGAELQKVAGERDARAKEKGEAQQQVVELNNQIEELSLSLAVKDSQSKLASEEAEMILLHLQQVQEELKYYFTLCRRQSEMLSSSEKLAKRTAELFSKMTQ